jgi:hypothetical protein
LLLKRLDYRINKNEFKVWSLRLLPAKLAARQAGFPFYAWKVGGVPEFGVFSVIGG